MLFCRYVASVKQAQYSCFLVGEFYQQQLELPVPSMFIKNSQIILVVALKDVRTQKFPRTDFFETLTAGRK